MITSQDVMLYSSIIAIIGLIIMGLYTCWFAWHENYMRKIQYKSENVGMMLIYESIGFVALLIGFVLSFGGTLASIGSGVWWYFSNQ